MWYSIYRQIVTYLHSLSSLPNYGTWFIQVLKYVLALSLCHVKCRFLPHLTHTLPPPTPNPWIQSFFFPKVHYIQIYYQTWLWNTRGCIPNISILIWGGGGGGGATRFTYDLGMISWKYIAHHWVVIIFPSHTSIRQLHMYSRSIWFNDPDFRHPKQGLPSAVMWRARKRYCVIISVINYHQVISQRAISKTLTSCKI